MEIRFYGSLPPEAERLRERVFVEEQGFRNEFDALDERAVHAVVFEDGEPVAVGRFYEGEGAGEYVIGRIAVAKGARGRGIGSRTVGLIEREILRRGGTSVRLHAQTDAEGFYKSMGYAAFGELELDEGCPHVWMKKELAEDVTQRFDFSDAAVGDFIDALASGAPSPGGGAAAALCGAQGAALVSMVCELTLGNSKYEAFFELCRRVGSEAKTLSQRFLELARLDAEVFHGYSLAAKLPRETDAQRAFRDGERARTLKLCAEAPLMTLRAAGKGLRLAESLVGNSSKGLASDLFSAACCFWACDEAAAENVRVNLRYIKDSEYAQDVERMVGSLLCEAERAASRIKEHTRTGA